MHYAFPGNFRGAESVWYKDDVEWVVGKAWLCTSENKRHNSIYFRYLAALSTPNHSVTLIV